MFAMALGIHTIDGLIDLQSFMYVSSEENRSFRIVLNFVQDDFIWCILQWTLVMIVLSMLNRAYDLKWKQKFKVFGKSSSLLEIFNLRLLDDPEPEPEPTPTPQDGNTTQNPKYEVSDLPTYEEVTRSPVTLNPT